MNTFFKFIGYLVRAFEIAEALAEKYRLAKANEKANHGDQRDLESSNGGTRHTYDGMHERPKKGKSPGDLAD